MKESFPPAPLFKELNYVFFSAHSGLDRDVRTNQSIKVLVKLFQKLAQVKGA